MKNATPSSLALGPFSSARNIRSTAAYVIQYIVLGRRTLMLHYSCFHWAEVPVLQVEFPASAAD
ncbi:hypothetical protein MNQ98_15635 [Paenibacillus sp. N3/727]|uniref:hypothetical protein n=1 Tax=Paenibacillus sp. N3/727 TaxID=2925845 RepID=UPI001F52ECAD|nr:hypothetical protein [Paenibacillus sp. N3/727]UNK15983.1 hypothetical protein MNQ98_15635 [Paenibacillus sp. N3/727]